MEVARTLEEGKALQAAEVLAVFENIRRAQSSGGYAPHKPLLLLLALGRLQRGEPAMARLANLEPTLKRLLTEFGPTNAAQRAHLPFWHLKTDAAGKLWQLRGPSELFMRPAGNTPALGQLRGAGVEGGFAREIEHALRTTPGLIAQVGHRLLDEFFPSTLHDDIASEVGLDLTLGDRCDTPPETRRRDPGFRDRVLRAYEYRCCICGFNLVLGGAHAGLEGAHIHWHTAGGPDVEQNGLALCSLHHNLFDRGAFTIEPNELRIVFSQHAITGERGLSGVLAEHGRKMLPAQNPGLMPRSEYLAWNRENVFKDPAREIG